MQESNKGINTFTFSVGGDIKQAKSFGTTSIIICGKEKLSEAVANPHPIEDMGDGLKPDKSVTVKLDEFKSWFTLDNTAPDTGKACKVIKYDIVATPDQGAEALTDDPMIKYENDSINVLINKVPLNRKSYYLRA